MFHGVVEPNLCLPQAINLRHQKENVEEGISGYARGAHDEFMTFFHKRYRVESARMRDHDYSSGWYFVTMCTCNRMPIFGHIQNRIMCVNEMGAIAWQCWESIPEHFPLVRPDAFVVMPDHVHGILRICHDPCDVETQNFASLQRGHQNHFGPQSRNLASVIRGFKIGVKSYATKHGIDFGWQPRFHDRIIRDNDALDRIRRYIRNNPRE